MAETADGAASPGARAYDPQDRRPRVAARPPRPGRDRAPERIDSLEALLAAAQVGDGARISLHHHLRDGDAVLNAVLSAARARGLEGLRLAPSAIFPVHAPLAEAIASGLVAEIATDYAAGPAAAAIASGGLARPALFQSHGGRARAIVSGELEIDLAVIAAPRADRAGAATGALGRAACGPLGYPAVDAGHARRVAIVAEEIQEAPLIGAEIPAGRADFLVALDRIGDPAGIATGALRPARDPIGRLLADRIAAAIAASGVMADGFSFQTGAGGASLAAAAKIGEAMRARRLRGSFVCGGICGVHAALAREGLFAEALDVQAFDLEAVASFRDDPWHKAISAAEYASPLHPDPAAHRLAAVALGAAEIDRDFNVNVACAGDGRIIGGAGGHQDVAAGADLTVVATRLTAGGHPKLVQRVRCLTTPGRDVDLLVTEAGIAVNPRRPALRERLEGALGPDAPILEIDALIAAAAATAEHAPPPRREGPARVLIEYRDGSIIDRI